MTDDIFKYIDVERTIAEAGYNPLEKALTYRDLVFALCTECGADRGLIKFTSFQKYKVCKKCSGVIKAKKREEAMFSIVHFSLEQLTSVDVKKTIEHFGYSPQNLSKGSSKKVFAICKNCKCDKGVKTFVTSISYPMCLSCSNSDPEKNLTNKEKKERGKSSNPLDQERNRRYYQNAKEKRKKKSLDYYYEHIERVSDSQKRYREENKEALKKARKIQYDENRDTIIVNRRESYRQAVMNRAIAIVTSNPIEE